MKKTILLLTLTLFCTALAAQKIITVNGAPGSAADYHTLQEATKAAQSGDIIMLHGFMTYGTDTIKKKLAIIGPGYFLGENPKTQVNKNTAQIVNLVITGTDANQTMITGVDITGSLKILSSNNVLISRNRIAYIYLTSSNSCIINQNYVFSYTYQQLPSFLVDCSIGFLYCSGLAINNNVLNYSLSNRESSAEISNNIIGRLKIGGYADDCYVFNSYIYNNIIGDGCYSSSQNNTVENNIIGWSYGTVDRAKYGNGNIFNVKCDTLFVGKTGYSTDGQYQLKAKSVAKGAGKNGTDMGIFGGDNPYVLSGIPFVPNIYELKTPGTGTTGGGLEVHIKAKVNK